jgi:glutamine synthetase
LAENCNSGQIKYLDLALKIFDQLKLTPQIGIEWEFYLEKSAKKPEFSQIDKFISSLKSNIEAEKILLLDVEKEQGEGQIEVKTTPYKNIKLLCQDLTKIKEICHKTAQNLDLACDFSAQKYDYDCSNSLQFNLSLVDEKSVNIFAKNNNQENQTMLFCIGGILQDIKKYLPFLAPHKKDQKRFDFDLNVNLHKNGKYSAPVNISWGYDNRTALLRIVGQGQNRRIEFRPCPANCDFAIALAYFLKMAADGIINQTKAPKAIYGNAFDEQYFLEKLNSS